MIRKIIALDWLGMKIYQKVGLFLLVHIPIMCFVFPHFIFFLAVLSIYLSIFPFGLEEKDDLSYLYLTLPITRREVVTARYALSGIMFICGILIGSVCIPVIQPFSLMSNVFFIDGSLTIGFDKYFILLSISYLIYAILNLAIFPFLFKLGYVKGKMWGTYLPLLVMMMLLTVIPIIVVVSETVKDFLWKGVIFISENPILIGIGMFILATFILAISYLISIKVYSKRNF